MNARQDTATTPEPGGRGSPINRDTDLQDPAAPRKVAPDRLTGQPTKGSPTMNAPTCEVCGGELHTSKPARFCSDRCRQIARRRRARGGPPAAKVRAALTEARVPEGASMVEVVRARLANLAGSAEYLSAVALAERVDRNSDSAQGLVAIVRDLAAMLDRLDPQTPAADVVETLRARVMATRLGLEWEALTDYQRDLLADTQAALARVGRRSA